MSKVIEFPTGKTLQTSTPPKVVDEDGDCVHARIARGTGYQKVGSLRYEFETDVCQDCGAFVTSSGQYEDFKSWLLRQPPIHFRISKVRLRTNSLKTAESIGKRFRKPNAAIYRACLAFHSSDMLADEDWEWDTSTPKRYGYNTISPLNTHPLLYLRLDAWSHLAEMTIRETTGKVIDACLRQYAAGKYKFIHYLDSYLVL